MTHNNSSQQAAYADIATRTAQANLPPVSKLVVAIHGIGSQTRSDTIRSVARQFGDREGLPVMPLGFFHIGGVGRASFSRIDAPASSALRGIGFVEVFWADIPRKVASEADTLEETKAWGKSVISRAQATYLLNVKQRELAPADFDVGVGVIEEIVETISVLENLCYFAEKAGWFKFDLATLLRDYVNDVQVVAEFEHFREQIVFRFHNAMAQAVEYFTSNGLPVPDIHVVAHSEGTVVSFLAMLQAFSFADVVDPDEERRQNGDLPRRVDTSWIRHVRGFMTIGSPIDKHLLLWPRLWEGLKLRCSKRVGGSIAFVENNEERLTLDRPIKWRNYYDHGDPVGFELETAKAFLAQQGCCAFEFEPRHDFGYSRYVLPGKAHVDYWNDRDVFSHFIDDVVIPNNAAKPPGDRPLAGATSLFIPYLLTFVLSLGAVFALHKGVSDFLALDPSISSMVAQVGLLGVLLMGITVAARIPHMTKSGMNRKVRWRLVAVLAFLAGALPCYFYLPDPAADFVGAAFGDLHVRLLMTPAELGRLILIAAAAAVAATGWLTPRKARWGRRTLVTAGFGVAIAIVGLQAAESPPHTPIWPTALAAVAFLYLWWLAILVFDLAFVWHRYIRESVAIKTLNAWRYGRDAQPNRNLGFGKARKARASAVPAAG